MNSKYERLAKRGKNAYQLANIFLDDYFEGNTPVFPINPFEMLRHYGILISFRPFKNYEGIYVPADDENDIPIVGINSKRPITRQRYTAAHELCHFLKDTNSGCVCDLGSKNNIEKYAEKFAGELLMPKAYLREMARKYSKNGYVSFDNVLLIADYFGVSFEACLYKLAYSLHMIEGDTSADALKKKIRRFKPQNKREERGLTDTRLFSQLFDNLGNSFSLIDKGFAGEKFKTEYIYNDSRMEGIELDQEQVSEIVIDLREQKNYSKYSNEQNQNIVEIAGLSIAYDYAFDNYMDTISIETVKDINKHLFSAAPYPEFAGQYRDNNTLVIGAKFETVDCWDIYEEMAELDNEIQSLINKTDELTISEYILEALKIHHKLTVIHPFRDGNGRSSRVLLNMMLLRKGVSPTFFTESEKDAYKEALGVADKKNNYDDLLNVLYRSILRSNYELSPKIIP